MSPWIVLPVWLAVCGQVEFARHEIDGNYPGGYQVAVADLNADGRPDVIALSTQADRVDWYENPSWQQHPIARTDKNIDLAVHDLDGDGRPEIALASGFYFSESNRGGAVGWLSRSEQPDQPWPLNPIVTDPVVHRLRWGDLDGDDQAELIHAPLFGPGSDGTRAPKPAHLWALHIPKKLAQGPWKPWIIDETLTVLHGIYVGDLDGDGRDEILTTSFEGICRLDFEGTGAEAAWRKTVIAPGAAPVSQEPGAARGTSEVAPSKAGAKDSFLAAIEPWHGHQLVVYRPTQTGEWQRTILDDTLREGHALVVADFDGDGAEEIVAGWRGGGGGLALYAWDDRGQLSKTILDTTVTVEGLVAADLNGNGRLDLVAIGGRTNNLVWYDNVGNAARHHSGVGPAR
jgi:hypothetical protein